MGVIFQKNSWKFEQIYEKCMKCENFFKKGSPLCVIITPYELLEWALIEVLIAFEKFKMDCHIIQKPWLLWLLCLIGLVYYTYHDLQFIFNSLTISLF